MAKKDEKKEKIAPKNNKKQYKIVCADMICYKKNKWEDISKKKKFKSVALKDEFLQGKCMIMDD